MTGNGRTHIDSRVVQSLRIILRVEQIRVVYLHQFRV